MLRTPNAAALSLLMAGAVFVCGLAAAAEKKAEKAAERALPYLGPGAEKLSRDDYERVYKTYIQTSILLGYPFLKEKASACEQALSAIFRASGMFGYPVPAEAQQLQRRTRRQGGGQIESYEMAGVLIQLSRNADGAPEELFLVNSASPKATRRISAFAAKERLRLEKDPVTGLEKVRGIPVGYPHPFLTQDGQGLYVKQLRFNGRKEGCAPLDFQDNSWVGGYELSESRCRELQGDAQKVWDEELGPGAFAQRELERMKKLALASATAKGLGAAAAKELVEKHFTAPFTNEINVVGSAMRNLAQCNLLAIGRAAKGAAPADSAGAPQPGSPGETGNGAGSAK